MIRAGGWAPRTLGVRHLQGEQLWGPALPGSVWHAMEGPAHSGEQQEVEVWVARSTHFSSPWFEGVSDSEEISAITKRRGMLSYRHVSVLVPRCAERSGAFEGLFRTPMRVVFSNL